MSLHGPMHLLLQEREWKEASWAFLPSHRNAWTRICFPGISKTCPEGLETFFEDQKVLDLRGREISIKNKKGKGFEGCRAQVLGLKGARHRAG